LRVPGVTLALGLERVLPADHQAPWLANTREPLSDFQRPVLGEPTPNAPKTPTPRYALMGCSSGRILRVGTDRSNVLVKAENASSGPYSACGSSKVKLAGAVTH
jgi:hypothetical protein